MVDKAHALLEFLRYNKNAQTNYYIHSPFVYQFYLNVLEGAEHFPEIEKLRATLLQNHQKIIINDLGAKRGSYTKTISEVISKAAISKKYGLVLNRLANYVDAKNLLELGTSLGIGTSYLSFSRPDSTVISIEGSEQIADEARENLQALKIQNAKIITGNFDTILPEIIESKTRFDIVFLDGNHCYEPTLRYYHLLKNSITENGCMIFDDIYWSREMTKVWQEIKQDKSNTLTLDIYRMGIVFFGKEKLAKEDFVLRY